MPVVSISKTELSQRKELCFAGAMCDLHTNSRKLAQLLEGLSTPVNRDRGASGFDMRIMVDEELNEEAGEPHFRGMHHVVIASFGQSNVFIFDILRRRLSARIANPVAQDPSFWKEKLIPITLGVLGAAIGLVPVHCACLAMEEDSFLIAGASGAGKSTLSAALSLAGFTYISDDWTYISEYDGRLMAHGTSAPVKLLPDAIQHFQGLSRYSPHISMNGELAYEVNIAETFGGRIQLGCEPKWMIFLDRMQHVGSEFIELTSAETRHYLNSSVERLPAQLAETQEKRSRIIEKISGLSCWSFRYGGPPQFATTLLRNFITEHRQEAFV